MVVAGQLGVLARENDLQLCGRRKLVLIIIY